jgi:mannose-1-phosphate guanylyltransferase/mannose-6-phosphate isomerase
MTSKKILPVILSGGFGTRLWPISRMHNPKQFLKLEDGSSLFKKALNLILGDEFLPPIIVSHEAHKFFILDEMPNFSNLILEPVGRNTSASILLGVLKAKEMYGEDLSILVIPSDHIISDKSLFLKSIYEASKITDSDIILFGIKPTFPATGYGYIETDGLKVKHFKEKPNKKTAEKFLNQGNFFWNSGIFMFNIKNILALFTNISPKTLEICTKSFLEEKEKITTLNKSYFEKLDDISFDYEILEKGKNIYCIPMLSPWSDVGDLRSFMKNIKTPAKLETLNSKDVNIISERLVACIGLSDITIVDTKNALLIAKTESLQDVKKIVKSLKEKEADEILFEHKIYRPWGFYEILLNTPSYKVKRIFVKPDCKLSLQSHKNRLEHWFVVEGKPTITVNEEEFELKVNEFINIPLKAKHRLANNTNLPVIVIETQTGNYLDEDDITRHDDIYGRA